ncbi:hypothetical protein N1851_028306 [Merluccius polli]|uniref:Uncharacterized protein n=1 Tax=Merluccius polli TaxID=89951 RepID=A0AA47M8T0_MERPO|nr:hypothetical protein N1851_028306 [Merluccius polli]
MLATQLAILTSRRQRDWDLHLPLVLWVYRTAVQESTKCTPAVLMFGHKLQYPSRFGVWAAPRAGDTATPSTISSTGYCPSLLIPLMFLIKLQTSRQLVEDTEAK